MRKVITYGSFDLLHYGHINILKRAKMEGDHLTVCISSDSFNKIKNKKTALPLSERIELVKAIRYVDEIIVEASWEQKESDIIQNNIDIFVMGDDWEGEFDDLPCEVKYFKRTAGISSSLIKEGLSIK